MRDDKVAHLGTGVIVCRDYNSRSIGVITTISCDPKKYRVCATFAGQNSSVAQVLRRGRLLCGLVIHGYDVDRVVPVTSDLFEKNPEKSEPVWAAGCFGDKLDESMPGGYICTCNISKMVRPTHLVQTFVHSCPIGDGLIGAPVVNRFGKILGITIARSQDTANVNFGMRFDELKGGLAELVGGDSKDLMSSLLDKFKDTLLKELRKKHGVGSLPMKTKRSDAGSSSKKARKT